MSLSPHIQKEMTRMLRAGVWYLQLCDWLLDASFQGVQPHQCYNHKCARYTSVTLAPLSTFIEMYLIGCVLRAVFSSSMIICLPTSSSSRVSRVFL